MNIGFFSSKWKAFLLVFSLLFLINLLILDIKVFRAEKETAVITPAIEKPQAEVTPPDDQVLETNLCPSACLEIITEATASSLVQTIPLPTPITFEPQIKEFYIPLGSGSTKSADWEELAGVEAVIDSANFSNIKSIIFEASLHIPTANGKVYAKLYNVTDKHDVWFSKVWAEGSVSYRAESAEISLSPGRKLYRVMMRTTMSYEAILDSARVKILLK